MTRKDYVRIASALHFRFESPYRQTDQSWANGFGDAVYAVCDALAEDNPRFDRARFLDAVDMEGGR